MSFEPSASDAKRMHLNSAESPAKPRPLPLSTTLRFILAHPLNRGRPFVALAKYGAWQLSSRIWSEREFHWVGDAKLKVQRGMTGATGNIYCGLHEFVEMAFLLHLLRPGDLFLDVGANVGSYTVLASKVCGSRTIAFEPDRNAFDKLRTNIVANDVAGLVDLRRTALGDRAGEIAFTEGLDTENRVASSDDAVVQTVPVVRLDDIPEVAEATLMKLDVEGYEEHVLAGAGQVLASPQLLAVQSESHGQKVTGMLASFGFRPMFYDPFSRALGETDFGYRISNMLYLKDIAAVMQRTAAAPRRKVAGTSL